MGTIGYGEDISWSPIQEETLFTENGLRLFANLVEIPEDVQALESSTSQRDGVDSDLINSSDFCADATAKELQALFVTQTSHYARYFRYRQNALENLWSKREEFKNCSLSRFVKAKDEQLIATVAKRKVDFSARVSLLLLIPLIKSHSKTDPCLAEHSTQILFQCLKDCLPNSLSGEPLSCVTGLADLLTGWLANDQYLESVDLENDSAIGKENKPLVQNETIIGCLLSLACARLSLRLFVKTLLMLQQSKDKLGMLPLASVLESTVQYEKCGWRSNPSLILASNLKKTWQYVGNHPVCMRGDVIACDGKFLYILHGSCIVKLGSGKHNTLRGHVYAWNTNFPEGFLCFVGGKLIFRPNIPEKTYIQKFAEVVDTETLMICSSIEYSPSHSNHNMAGVPSRKTVCIVTDGILLYWLYYHDVPVQAGNRGATSGSNSTSVVVDVYLEVLEVKESDDKSLVSCVCEPVVLKYKETEPANNVSDFHIPLALRPVTVGPAAQTTQDENSRTSCGLTVNVLHRTPVFTDGTYIIMLIGHPNYNGFPVCRVPYNRCYSIGEGKFVKDVNLVDVPKAENPKWQNVSLANTGVCYDYVNNQIWTSSEDCIEEWSNVGALSYHHVLHQLSPKPRERLLDDDVTSPSDCMTATALQISFLCSAISHDDPKTLDLSYDLTLDDEYQGQILEILDCGVHQQDQHVLHSALILVQTLFSRVYANNSKLNDDIVAAVRLLIWKIICSDIMAFGESVCQEACHTLRSCLGIFYPSFTEQSAVMMILFNEPEENGIVYLKEVLLRDFTEALVSGAPSSSGCVGWFAEDVVYTIIKQCTAESCYFVSHAKDGKTKQFPFISPLLGYLKAIVTRTLEELYLGRDPTFRGDVEDLFERLVEGFKEVSKAVLDVFTSIDAKITKSVEETLSLLHNATKSSMYEQVMPIFLTALCSEKICNLSICKLLTASVMELTVILTKIASLHRKLCPLRHASSKNASQVHCFLQSMDKDTKKPFDKVFIPKPWLGPQTVASMHPVCDEYRVQRTVSLLGAKTLYLKFDERCATQYDYDKLVVYTGADCSGTKVCEYGGNSFGYGGRSVVKTGWPKDIVKVNGDTVTLSLEVKSTRERATPDKAVWGFRVIVAADQEYFNDKSKSGGGLNFYTDLALAGSYSAYYLLNMMYCGPLSTDVELCCSHLLKSKLLQRCIWKDSLTMIQDSPKTTKDSSTKLSSNVLDKLRTYCNSQRPTLRPSIQCVVQPRDIETVVLSAAVKHYGLTSCINKFELATGNVSKKKEYRCLLDVAEETFFKVDALVRQLQAMAELEKKWWQDLIDICQDNVQPSAAFFNDYHLQEDKAKELELLCKLKTIQFDPLDHEKCVGRLIQILDSESRVHSSSHHDDDITAVFPRTSAYVSCVMERAELLLSVTIVGSNSGVVVGRSVSNIDKTTTGKGSLSSGTDCMVTRSVSAPHLQQPGSEQFVQGVEDLQRFRRWDETLRHIHKTSRGRSEHTKCPVSVVEQIFTFIAGTPDQAVSCGSFLAAARTRWRRGKYRQLAILHMNKLAAISGTLGVTGIHLLGVVVSIMSQGTKLDDLECSGMLTDVGDEYGKLLRHIVDQSVGMLARYCEKLIVLATTPFTLCERQDVLRSSLILMINKLCSSSNLDTGLLDLAQRNHAWRSFQVLIDRLVSWESDKAHDPEEIEWSGVARQVATVLNSYLRYLESKVSRHDVTTHVTDPLHEVLELLQRISGSHLGECVLSEPHMIKTLLSVVIDRQASPKHVLTALTLLYSALPLTDPETTEPLTSPSMEALPDRSTTTSQRKPSYTLIKVLLNKLGELLLPFSTSDDGGTSSKRQRRSNGYGTSVFSVYVHNRGDIATHEIVQKVLSSSGYPYLFQVGLGSQMERAITLNRELSEHGLAEVLTDKMTTCLKQATRLAQSGICVSISSPQDVKGVFAESTTENHSPDAVCQERNKNLVGFGNTRPYVSGNVAQNMASEVVALLRNLLQVNSAWATAVRDALVEGLDDLSLLVLRLNDTYETDETDWCSMAQQVLATLCTLGGFKETVRPGCTAVISGEGLRHSKCRVLAVSSEQDTAQIILDDDEILDNGIYVCKHSFTVPLNVLSIPREHVLPLTDEYFHERLITAIGRVLEDNTTLASLGTLFANNDSDLEILRILAEVKTRVFALLDVYLDNEGATRTLLETSPELLPKLLILARSLDPGERQIVVENHCEELRALFKEYVRPVHHEFSTEKKRSNMPCQLDITRDFPIVFGCVFSRELTSVHYVCDPGDNTSGSQPRGALIFADKPFPERITSYYWEADIVSLGESENCESGPSLSFGFMPICSPSDASWTIPAGSCLIHSTGRAIHYEAGGPLSWNSVTLNLSMREHDVIGCGWERLGSDEVDGNARVTGRVFFTRNGKRLAEVLDGICAGLFPVVHIQKKNIRVLVNLGSRTFRHQEANSQRSSQESIQSMSMEEALANLEELPFCDCSESDELEEIICVQEGGSHSRENEGTVHQVSSSERSLESSGSGTRIEEQEYDSGLSQLEFLASSYDQMLDNGPPQYMTPDDDDCSHGNRKPRQLRKDPRSLLVKAWESKVFPTIRRRFRSETDRRSGLEQIRGALMEGLIDIAISTVEDLYEDSGGLPNALTFPRIEDIEAELDKTTLQDLRQAMTVQIVCSSVEALPGFAVPSMRKTFGLCGVVQEIDKRQELVLVDVYIRDEGSVFRYWYPVPAVKPRPPAFGRLSSLTFVDQEKVSFEIYTELWNCESNLARMYSRSAAIKLLHSKQKLFTEKQGIVELDILLEQISLLTGHHLRDPQSDGTLNACYIATTSSLKESLKTTSCSPLAVFFKDENMLRSQLVRLVLSCLSNDGKMKEISEKLFAVLKDYPLPVCHKQYEVSNVKFHKDVHFEKGAVTSVSCHGTADYFMPRIRVPSIEVFGYYGRRRLSKDGNVDKYKLTQYPNFAGHHVNFFGDGKNCLNPERLLPANRFHLRLGSSHAHGLVLRLNTIPQELLLCFGFMETLLNIFSCAAGSKQDFTTFHSPEVGEPNWLDILKSHTSKVDLNESTKSHPSKVEALKFHTPGVGEPPFLGEMLELLQRFLISTPSSPFVRELIFHLLAQILRLLGKTAPSDRLQFHYEASLSFFTSLKNELFKLVEKEVSVSRANALEYVLNCNFEKVKFTSYLQSLLEVVLAALEVQRRVKGTEWDSGDSPRRRGTLWDTPCEDVSCQSVAQEDDESSTPESVSSNLSIEVYTGGSENPGSFIPFFASLPVTESPRFTAGGESGQPARVARASSLRRQRCRERKKRSSKKATSQEAEVKGVEERDRFEQNPSWFEKLVSTLAVLSHLVRNESCGKSAVLDALGTSLAFPSMAWDRVIVVTNIPSSISVDVVIQGITKAARSAGGILPDEGIYLEDEPVISRPRGDEETGNQSSSDQPVQTYVSAVVQLRTSMQIDRVRQRLQQEKSLTIGSTSGCQLQVLKVSSMLLFEGGWAVTKACQSWENFLLNKLLDSVESFTPKALNALKEIFLSCHVASRITADDKVIEYYASRKGHGAWNDVTGHDVDTSSILLSAHDIGEPSAGNLMYVFLKSLRESTKLGKEEILDVVEQYGCHGNQDIAKLLHVEGFLQYVKENVKTDKRAVWKAFHACGYNFNHQRSTEVFPFEVEREHERWSLDDDKTLIKFIDDISKNLSASPQRLNAEEIFLESDLTNPCFASLKQFSRRSIGSRFVLHKYLNQFIQRLVLPVVDLRVSRTHKLSTACLLTSAKSLLFRNTKISELNRVLDLSAQRTADDLSPEISIDPLESIEASKVAETGPQLYQVARQLSKVSSSKLRVKVATGGDPSFPLRVVLRGEQVLGLGGAYRHFMWIMAREAQSSHLGLLIPCPSAAANRNKGKYILRPGPMTLSERQILVFFGQLLGIAMRSDIPLALDILPSFWKSILGLSLDEVDLHDADILTYNYIRRLSEISLKEDFERLCMEADISETRFVFTSLNGEEVPLCPNGNDLLVTWENRLDYAKAVQEYRLQELSCVARVRAIKAGLATIVPLHVLTILNANDLEVRTCGIPNVDIDFLKIHTTYVAGIRPTDRHIEYFWNALESFSQDEQRKFIKFACNQERLPGRCSCQDGSSDIHVPPYPMKIGPPDGRGPPDLRYIRVETCMFMVKLPRYTAQTVMREKLLYAINCREDPLTDFR